MTIEELNQAIGFEARQEPEALEHLIDDVTKRAKDKWLQNLPPALKVRWNVRNTDHQPDSGNIRAED